MDGFRRRLEVAKSVNEEKEQSLWSQRQEGRKNKSAVKSDEDREGKNEETEASG